MQNDEGLLDCIGNVLFHPVFAVLVVLPLLILVFGHG